MAQRFGVTRDLFFDLMRAGLVTGLLLGAFFVAYVVVGGPAHHGWGAALLFCFGIIAMPVLACVIAGAVVAAFSVQVSSGLVRQMLFDRFELSEFGIADFEGVDESRGALVFASRRRMNIAGMHETELRRLEKHIRELQAAAPPNTSLERTREG